MPEDRSSSFEIAPYHSAEVPGPLRGPQGPTLVFPDADMQAGTLPLSHYLWILRRHWLKVTCFIAAVVLATAIVTFRITPVYQSTATLYVDRQEAKGLVGQDSQAASYSNLDQESFLASQMKMIQSDAVVRPVVEKYELLEKEKQFEKVEERGKALDAPMMLKNLRVVRPPNTYLLQVSYRSHDAQLAADVANGIAQSYIEHTYNIRIRSSLNMSKFAERQIEELRAKMEGSSARLMQLERELNVINPEEKTSILSARLLQLNSEYTRAQADRMKSEATWSAVKNGSLEAAQVSAQGESLKRLQERLNEASEKFAELKAHFGVNHPEYRKAFAQQKELQTQMESMKLNIGKRVQVEFDEARDREQMLARSVQETKGEYDRINSRSHEYQRAKREAEADKNLYEELMRKIREAGINAGFQNNVVRLADSARPGWKPVFPDIPLNLILAFVFASLLAVATAILSDTLDNTLRDPEQATRSLNTQILGTLPAVKNLRSLRIPAQIAAPPGSSQELILSGDGETSVLSERRLSPYDEAVRTIRNSVLLTDFDRRIRTLLFTSATASEGKSTTAAHLALAHAEQGKSALLIDCDLRQPSQHRIFQIENAAGMTNILNEEIGWRDALIHPVNGAGLDLLIAGPPSRRAADLMGQRLLDLLEEMGREYDLVVLDAPPLLGFPESMQLANQADGVVVVTRAGETSRKAVAAALTTLQHLRANVLGVVLNQVKKHHSDHYYYYGYYGKYYKRYQEAAGGA